MEIGVNKTNIARKPEKQKKFSGLCRRFAAGNKKAAPESFRGGIKGLKDSSAERGCDYFVTRSSHLTMASMAIIETAQTITKILHVAEIEIRL